MNKTTFSFVFALSLLVSPMVVRAADEAPATTTTTQAAPETKAPATTTPETKSETPAPVTPEVTPGFFGRMKAKVSNGCTSVKDGVKTACTSVKNGVTTACTSVKNGANTVWTKTVVNNPVPTALTAATAVAIFAYKKHKGFRKAVRNVLGLSAEEDVKRVKRTPATFKKMAIDFEDCE